MGLLTEAVIRVPLVYLLPPSVMVGLSTAMAVLAFGGLAVWTGRYTAAKAPAAHHPAGAGDEFMISACGAGGPPAGARDRRR